MNRKVLVFVELALLSLTLPVQADEPVNAVVTDPVEQATADAGEVSATQPPSSPVIVRISPRLFQAISDGGFDEVREVKKTVLGARVVGSVHTVGKTTVTLVPESRGGAFAFTFSGRCISKTVAYRAPVMIDTTTTTSFRSRKIVGFDDQLSFTSTPAETTATTQSHTDGIRTRNMGWLGRGIQQNAWGQVNAARPQAEAIANEETRREITKGFDAFMVGYLTSLNGRLNIASMAEAFLPIDDRKRQLRVRDEHVSICVGRPVDSLGELQHSAPPLRAPSFPVVVCISQSVIGNELAKALIEYRDARARKMSEDTTRRSLQSVPAASQSATDANHGSVGSSSLANDQPEVGDTELATCGANLRRLMGLSAQTPLGSLVAEQNWVTLSIDPNAVAE